MVVLIWVQTDCKSYQQTTKVAAGKEKLKSSMMCVKWGTCNNDSLYNRKLKCREFVSRLH